MLLYVLLGLAILVAAIIAIVAIGPDRFITTWNRIPTPMRTVINVAIGAVIAWALSDGLQLLLALDMPPWLKVLLAGVSTAVVRAMNPADDAYGVGTTHNELSDGDSSSGDEIVVNPEDITP